MPHLEYLIAAISTLAFFVLWFWVARKELRTKQSMLQSAQIQLFSCKERYCNVNYDKEAETVLKTSLGIYLQTLDIYNKTLCKPCFFIPGILMGFRKEKSMIKPSSKP